MPNDLAQKIERFSTGHYRPTTFLERGVVVSFTTPMLLGARLRLADRQGLELVIANPSGGRGFYVVPWSSLPEFSGPTLHDEKLWSALSEKATVTPEAVREAVQSVALGGYRGRAAAAAAAAAVRNAPAACIEAVFMLLMRLIRQTETAQEAHPPVEDDAPSRRDARGKRAILRLAARIGIPPAAVGDCLHGLATVFQDIGAPREARPARMRRQIAEITTMTQEVLSWSAASPAAQAHEVGPMICDVAELTLQCCARLMTQVDAALGDMAQLLLRWRTDPSELVTLAARLDWLLDGWPLICSLWEDARRGNRLTASWEMAMLVPVVPREAEAWCGIRADWDRPWRLRRVVRMHEDWRTGHMHMRVARNERILVRAA